MIAFTKPTQKAYHCPWWINKMSHRTIPRSIRDFYAYLCCFGENGNWQWNCRLAKKCRVTERTIRRWLAWLKKYRLIVIEKPYGRQRIIHPIYYPTPVEWFAAIPFSGTRKTMQKVLHPVTEFEKSRQRNRQALFAV